MEFDIDKLLELETYYGTDRVSVIYDKDEQEKYLGRVIEDCFSAYSSNQLPLFEAELACRSLLDICVSTLKHGAFHEEAEVRLVLPNSHVEGVMDHLVKFQHSDNLIIPYIPISQGKPGTKLDALKKVIIGPAASAELVRRSIEIFLRVKAYEIKIETSNIPYRGG